jgi:hypothetical protein
MDELRGRIDRLERQLRELENQRWRWTLTAKAFSLPLQQLLWSFPFI